MRNNFLICTLLAGLTQSIQLSGEAHQQEHAAEHEADLQAHHDAEKAAEAEAQPPKEGLIELKRERFEDLDFLQIDTSTTTSTGTCGAWHDRVKNGQNIFYGVQSGSAEFVDPTFPHETAIRDDGNPSFVNGGGLQSASQSAEWSTALTHDLEKEITPSLAQLVSVHMISVKERSATAGSCTAWPLSQRSPAESRESSSTMDSAQMESTESSFTSSESQPLLSLMTVFHSALQEARSSARSVQMVPSGESFLRKPSQRLSEHTRR